MKQITGIKRKIETNLDLNPRLSQKDARDEVIVQPRIHPELKEPPLYRIIILNDDFTPMEFVVRILQALLHKSSEEATEIMFQVHYNGSAECGTFTREIAETKAEQIITCARQNSYPLRCHIEQM
ncbi:MAG: ATP-dependent Clp protease adapter ClpS [Alphaproteobacteria bacterium]